MCSTHANLPHETPPHHPHSRPDAPAARRHRWVMPLARLKCCCMRVSFDERSEIFGEDFFELVLVKRHADDVAAGVDADHQSAAKLLVRGA